MNSKLASPGESAERPRTHAPRRGTADNIVYAILHWIKYWKTRSSTPVPGLQDRLSDQAWVRQARFCAEAGVIETQIRAAARREAFRAIRSAFDAVAARVKISRGFDRSRPL